MIGTLSTWLARYLTWRWETRQTYVSAELVERLRTRGYRWE